MSASGTKAGRGERAVAILVFALPLLYLLTERTRDVYLWRWSKTWLVAITVYAVAYLLLLFSYSRPWPAVLAVGRKFLVATAVAALVLVLACEAYLRATDDAPFQPRENRGRHAADADVGHVYLPNYEQVIQTREFSTRWRSNAQGLRGDRDFGPKPAGVVRVLVVGDSFTVGDQVAFEDTYPSVMQAEFDRRFGPGRVEVLNAGFPGFGTIHERKWIEKFACALEPDLVVVGSTPNDLVENPFPILYVALDGALVDGKTSHGDVLKYEARRQWYSLPGWVARSQVMRKLDLKRAFDRVRGKAASPHRRAFQAEQDKKSLELYSLFEREVLAARDAAARCGAKFAVLAIPFLEQLGEPRAGEDFTCWGRRVQAIGERGGFPVVDLLPDFLAAGDPAALFWREDSHCRAAGYRLIGVGASSSLAGLGSAVGLPMLDARAR